MTETEPESQRQTDSEGGGERDRQTETEICSPGTTINLSSEDQNQKNASLDWQETHKADTGRGW